MQKQIFVNLTVSDLEKSKTFFSALGFTFKPEFTNDDGACLVISDTIFAMLLTPTTMKRFTTKEIADSRKSTEMILALSADSRAEVDEVYNKAIAAGGTKTREAEEHGWMYGQSFEDLDGHQWEIFWSDETLIPQNPGK